MSTQRVSLFVATYEMPRHLALVCAALARQRYRDFEVLFCDDGSGPETAAIIQEFTATSGLPTRHLWQTHQGFRKCKILNEGLRQARGEIFVFLDGDCVPHPDFIGDHVRMQSPGYYLAGRRVELGPELSARLSPPAIRAGLLDGPSFALLRSVLRQDSEYFQRSVRIPWPPLRRVLKLDRVADLKGCNYSVSRAAMTQLNGFDEEYEGYGREDTDVELRLQNLGLQIKSLKGLALQFHVWHPRREFTPKNDQRLEDLKTSGRVRCARGWQSAD